MKSKSKLGVIVIGVVMMLLAVIGFFVIGRLANPPATTVYIAAQDITMGTSLDELPSNALTAVPVQGNEILSSLVTKADLTAMQAAGGSFVVSVGKGDPITINMIASSANAAGATNLSLSNSDPNMVIAHLDVYGLIPDSVRVGDRLDLAVAVSTVRFDQSYAISLANTVAKAQGEETDISVSYTTDNGEKVSYDASNPFMDDEGMVDYYFQAPVAKIIVSNARVVNVSHTSSQSVSTSDSGTAQTETVQGSIEYVDVLIPRESFEWVAMAQEAGHLSVSLVSPMASEEAPATMGATLQDLVEKLYADRGLSVEDAVVGDQQ